LKGGEMRAAGNERDVASSLEKAATYDCPYGPAPNTT